MQWGICRAALQNIRKNVRDIFRKDHTGGIFSVSDAVSRVYGVSVSVTVLNNLLRGESFYLVLVLILGLVWYGLLSGIEGRARVYELLFWVILIPLFIMLASALDEVKTDYWNPVFFTGKRDFLREVIMCLSVRHLFF